MWWINEKTVTTVCLFTCDEDLQFSLNEFNLIRSIALHGFCVVCPPKRTLCLQHGCFKVGQSFGAVCIQHGCFKVGACKIEALPILAQNFGRILIYLHRTLSVFKELEL